MVPEAPALDKLLANYKSKVTVAHGEVFDPTPANIESRVKRAALLDGMKAVVLSKKTEGAMVDAANAYHDVYDKPFLKRKIPDQPPPDLDMTPRR